jgi:glucokinase
LDSCSKSGAYEGKKVQTVNSPFTMGVDLGGTKINLALVDISGRLLSTQKFSTRQDKEPKKVITDIIAGIDRCLSEAGQEAKAVGVGIAAQVDFKGGVQGSPNLGWRNVPLKKKLEEKIGVPVIVTNDVRAATWGEWRFGSGRGVDHLTVLFVGTGIGGGVISSGKLLEGCTNTGGELGHTTVVYGGRQCHCPNKGCLESYAGGWAIAERAQDAVNKTPKEGKQLKYLAGSVEEITAETVSQAYKQGDSLAQRIVEETGQYLGAGVVSIVNSFNPCRVVLGGGVIEGIPELIQMVKNFTRKRALEAAIKKLEIVKAKLGADAGVIGAAVLAQELI